MSLTDKTYFVKDINIPASDYSDLDNYITRYEKEILIKLLGYELYTLVAAYDGTPGVITDLVEGKEYTVNDKTVKWNGLVNSDLVSLIAYYVFYWWVRNKVVTVSTVGTLKQKGENADNASSNQILATAWNKMEHLYQSTDYPYESAYTFLTENESDYPTWEFTPIGKINSFGI